MTPLMRRYRVMLRDEERGVRSTHYLTLPSGTKPEDVRERVDEERADYETVLSIDRVPTPKERAEKALTVRREAGALLVSFGITDLESEVTLPYDRLLHLVAVALKKELT